MMTAVNMVHVPYRGSAPAVTDLLAGPVQVMFADTPPSIEHIRAYKLRALSDHRYAFGHCAHSRIQGRVSTRRRGRAAPARRRHVERATDAFGYHRTARRR